MSQHNALPYKKLPNMWNYLYPFISAGPNPVETVSQFLNSTRTPLPGTKSLYVHIPFCDTICTFCPFIRSTNYQDKLQPYVDALLKELKVIAATPYISQFKLDAIYVGGGTPSVLSPQMIEDLCTTIQENFTLTDDVEFSFEVEAKSATEDKLKAMAANGVNRISFGVQTFNPYYRKVFNLTATIDEIKRTRDLADKYFKAYNMDLLYQLPGQTMEQLHEDLEQVRQLATTTVDVYPLEYLVTSKGFLNMIKAGKVPEPPKADDKVLQHQFVNSYLLNHGYEQTHIYTFARQDAKYKEFRFGGTIYGRYEDEYIGCGQAAASYLSGLSHMNSAKTDEYIRAVENGTLPVMRANEYQAKEKGLIYFPKHMKVSMEYLRQHDLPSEYWEKLEKLETMGLVEQKEGMLHLTELGKIWYMHVMIELLPDDQKKIYDSYVETLQEDREFYENTELAVIQ
ncbi:coproporphyrinogen-III oxidase family protein [Tumebacillus lipolyticus]|uniref:Heme chaperone HemW n=1 Tax=Tumebacillus lipolyticus TaxID=1280370 RepID=A0ABW5A281_9BACL